MPDFDFLKDLDPKPEPKPAPEGKAPESPTKDDALDFDFLSELTPEKPATGDPLADALGELEIEAAPAAEFQPLADLSADTTGALSDDPIFDVDDLLTPEPVAEAAAESTPAPAAASDDPLADALSELETEAAPAATFEPLADMTADTTGALSDDPQFNIDDITAVPAAASTAIAADDFDFLGASDAEPKPLADEVAPLQSDATFRWEDRDSDEPPEHRLAPAGDATMFDTDATMMHTSAPEPATVADSVELAAIVGGAMGVAMVAPEILTPPEPAWEPPTIHEDPLPPAPDAADPTYPAYESLTHHIRQTSLLGSIEAVLGWDERCMMPAAGTETRAEQITMLSGLIHERLTDPRIGEWLQTLDTGTLAADPHGEAGATVRQIRRQYEKRNKLPKTLVEELAHTAVVGQATWQEARHNNDFASFAPLLEKMVRLKREQAAALGFGESPYDALLDEFEQGEVTSRVTQVLGALRDELVPLVAKIRDSGRKPRIDLLERRYPVELQRAFGRKAAAEIGFDFQRGRLDVTAHPFCTGLGPNDCRITTRYDENFFNAGYFGILHEAGHGIYDQGLRADQYGLPLGEAVSMGIHESQSRMWEILVGRSLPYWRKQYASARRTFPEALAGVTLGHFYSAINDVRPSLIRVEADEFTYNLHILIRFELEQALISGELAVADLPAAWNQKYRDYLGIEPPTDADGVLQDIHWSAGLFGYFPTYSLGNLYAAQFFEKADQDLGGLAQQFERGEFQYLRRWLNVNIHRHGQRYTAAELVERVTGAPLSHEPLMRHLRAKFDLLYGPDADTFVELDVPDADALATMPYEDSQGGVAMQDAGDVGGYGIAMESAGFDGMSVGGGIAATPGTFAPLRAKPKKQASSLAMIIVFGGIVLGGVFGISLGLLILLWWKGPVDGDVLKLDLQHKLPSWMVPAPPAPPTPEPLTPEPSDSSTPPAN